MSRNEVFHNLRRGAPDRYLACLFLPRAVRAAAFAIWVFDLEVRRIPELVSEAPAGEIRIQWWREVIAGEREHGGHPIAMELLDAIDSHQLPRAAFDHYLQARIFDLYHDPMPDRPALEAYCGETASALLQNVAICAGAQPGTPLAEAAGHAGVALGIGDLLRATAWHRASGRCYLPLDMLAATGLDAGAWLAEPDERHGNAVGAAIDLAKEHYEIAMKAIRLFDASQRAAFLPLAPVPAYLRTAGRLGTRSTVTPVEINPLHRQWIFWRTAAFGLPPA